ncbi:MAG: Gfo/Idh/MocA family oxidoreductase, partial [Armatimonadota bacterium]
MSGKVLCHARGIPPLGPALRAKIRGGASGGVHPRLFTTKELNTMAVRVGFLGCGGMNRAHMDRIKAMRGAEVVAVCDVDQDRAQAAAEEF